jgi:bacteriocin-like protein
MNEMRELTIDELDKVSGGKEAYTFRRYTWYDLRLDLAGGVIGAEVAVESAQGR